MIKLYDYFRSTASYRVRIALNIKQQAYELVQVHLVKDGGEQHGDAYRGLNPQGRVPALQDGDLVLTQSMAIVEYLEAKYPEPTLLPGNLAQQAHMRAIADIIACDIHPLNNLGVLQYLVNELHCDEQQKLAWYHHWLRIGFDAIEKMLTSKGAYCFGDQVSLADICLIPQVYNAERFEFDMQPYPRICQINQACLELPAFSKAAPQASM